MFHTLTTLSAIIIVQFFIEYIWYSKFLFGNLFVKLSKFNLEKTDTKSIKKSFVMTIISHFIKAVLIYSLSYDLFILQSFYLFKFILLISFLILIEMFNDVIWNGKSFTLYILNATQTFTVIIASFFVAFVSYSIF